LRIEDTDKERSTKENVDAILEGMEWLGLDWDEGPIRQTERYDRYRQVIDQWLEEGKAYHCYCSKEELDELREQQMASGGHVRYGGRCRNRKEPRPGVDPVVRFKNPTDGEVVVEDLVRGRVVFQPGEEVIEDVAADFDINMGKLGQPLRVAVTGGPVSPPIDVTLWLVGQERTIRRMDHAISLIETRVSASQ